MAKIFIWIISIVIFTGSVFVGLFLLQTEHGSGYHGKVYIKKEGEKYTLIRNGEPFFIKGGSGYTNIEKLVTIGGNTIKTWDTTNLGSILDEAQKHNVAVIAGFNMLESQYSDLFYSHPEKVARQYKAFKNFVERYKDHPALLMWCVGNELEFRLDFDYLEFYLAYRDLVKMVQETDPEHPVTTTFYGRGRQDMAIFRLFNMDLDLVSINRFSDLHTLKSELETDEWLWNWPFVITEWGIRGPWEAYKTHWDAPIENFDDVKAEELVYAYNEYFPKGHPRFLGSLVFFWGGKQEGTHTWFSLLNPAGNTCRSVEAIQQIYTGITPDNLAPFVTEIKLEEKVARENVILLPGVSAEIKAKAFDPDGDSLSYRWEILKEQWHYTTRVTNKKPEPLKDLVICADGATLKFKTPLESGPYRAFVYINDHKGHFGTANIPFYIIK